MSKKSYAVNLFKTMQKCSDQVYVIYAQAKKAYKSSRSKALAKTIRAKWLEAEMLLVQALAVISLNINDIPKQNEDQIEAQEKMIHLLFGMISDMQDWEESIIYPK